MRIAVLSAASSSHTVKIVNSLVRAGDEVYLFSLPNHRDEDGAVSPDVRLFYLGYGGGKGYYMNAPELRRLLLRHRIDVLSAHYASGYGTLAGLAGFHPYALSVWGSDIYDFPNKGLLNKHILKDNLRRADLILSTSECMGLETSKYIHGDKRIVITPFGVDTEAFCPPEPSDEDRDGGIVRIGTVKSISAIYGTEYLLRAYAMLRSSSEAKAELHIYGDGDQLDEMKKLAAELGIDGETRFYGRIRHEDVPAALRQLDIFCAPSISESFGVSVIEAMATAMPCVTSDAPGLAEVMEDGVTGYVVPAGSCEDMAEKMILLAENAELRRSLGVNARTHVLEKYDLSDNMVTLRAALAEVAGR